MGGKIKKNNPNKNKTVTNKTADNNNFTFGVNFVAGVSIISRWASWQAVLHALMGFEKDLVLLRPLQGNGKWWQFPRL